MTSLATGPSPPQLLESAFEDFVNALGDVLDPDVASDSRPAEGMILQRIQSAERNIQDVCDLLIHQLSLLQGALVQGMAPSVANPQLAPAPQAAAADAAASGRQESGPAGAAAAAAGSQGSREPGAAGAPEAQQQQQQRVVALQQLLREFRQGLLTSTGSSDRGAQHAGAGTTSHAAAAAAADGMLEDALMAA